MTPEEKETKLRRIGNTLHATVRATRNVAAQTVDILDSMSSLDVSKHMKEFCSECQYQRYLDRPGTRPFPLRRGSQDEGVQAAHARRVHALVRDRRRVRGQDQAPQEQDLRAAPEGRHLHTAPGTHRGEPVHAALCHQGQLGEAVS